MKNLFLTGKRHVGKTTLIREVISSWKGPVGGFMVERRRYPDGAFAFDIVDIMTFERASIASSYDGNCWLAQPGGFDSVGVRSIVGALANATLIVMDELGFFELEAKRFQEAVFDALSGKVPVLGVLKADLNPFISAVKERPDVLLIEVTRANREEIRRDLRRWVELWGVWSVRMGSEKGRMV